MNTFRNHLPATTTLFVTLGMPPSAPHASMAEAVPKVAGQFSDHDFIFADLKQRNAPVTNGAYS